MPSLLAALSLAGLLLLTWSILSFGASFRIGIDPDHNGHPHTWLLSPALPAGG